MFRLGRYARTVGPGLYLPIPLVEWRTVTDLHVITTAAETIAGYPAALELRRLQMIAEVGAEQNSMTIFMMPSEFVDMARALGAKPAPIAPAPGSEV